MPVPEESKQETIDVFKVAIEEIYSRIARKVREDSEKKGCLTTLVSLDSLTPEPELMKVEVNLVEMVQDERYKDISFVITPAGNTYLYSNLFISKEDADILAENEEIEAVLAEKIRDISKREAKLTSPDSLLTPESKENNREEQIKELREAIGEMSSDERYKDIESVSVKDKGDYYYSNRYITANYAEILARAEAGDPLSQIAATVRNDSKIYPRATGVLYLTDPVFGLDPKTLDVQIDELLSRPEYKDIKLVRASNGAGYLYSDLYISEALARANAEWNEGDRWNNP